MSNSVPARECIIEDEQVLILQTNFAMIVGNNIFKNPQHSTVQYNSISKRTSLLYGNMFQFILNHNQAFAQNL
jgi:hypothetical protein